MAFRHLDHFARAIIDASSVGNWSVDDLVMGYADDHSDRNGVDDAAADAILAQGCPDVENLYAVKALRESIVPARVVGYGTTPAVTGLADDGRVIVTYLGEGFPSRPGFGAALVDDSSEVLRGILIWDAQPPPADYPRIGTITNTSITMPLIGVLVNWPSVNSDRCPLFAELDTIAQ